MALLIGQAIYARELEQATSQWSPERFASMCNDLVWATSGRQYSTLPRFNARIYAADDGVDAEWDVEIPLDGKGLTAPIVGPGWNVFQYKKRDLIAQDRKRIISNLKSGLKKALANVAKKKGRYPDRYVLFVNVDLRGDDVASLRESILHDYDRCSEAHVEVIGAGVLTAFLNDNPHLRAAYFNPLSFKTWAEADRSHHAQKLFRLDVGFVSREEELNRLRSLVDDPRVSAILVTGPHDIGKSRLVLEATGDRNHHVVFALDPRSMKVEDYRSLVAERQNIICAVEDPDPDKLELLINEILGIAGLKVIVTLPTTDQAPAVSYGRDERIQSLFLGPLNDEDSRKLLNATGKRLDFGVESWILNQAGGNPGILLAAASVGDKLGAESIDFTEDVGREFEKRIKYQLGQDALKCAELLSPLTHVGISGKFESELKIMCDLFGKGWKAPNVFSTLTILEEAGLARRGGSFAEVTIPILANYLTAKLLRGRKDEVFALFGRLEGPARLRFLRRLSQVEEGEAEAFWDALFDSHDTQAPFASLRSAIMHAHMLRMVAVTVPERTMQLIQSGLVGKSRDEQLVIIEMPRRELMWALEELLLREKTSAAALRCLALLGEAETEDYGNNATGVFCESFDPLHPQLPLGLDERLHLLNEILSSKQSTEMQMIGVKAIESALDRKGVRRLRRSSGAWPLDTRPVMTYGDVWNYIEALVDLLMTAAQSDEPTVGEAASAVLPNAIAESAIQARPEAAVAKFKTVTDWVLTRTVPISIADLADALRFAEDGLEKRKVKADEETALKFQNCVQEINTLLSSNDQGDFPNRLKRWAGKWTRDDRKYEIDDQGRRLYRGEKELCALAEEAAKALELLTENLLTWLCSGEAKRGYMFFRWLGRVDSKRKWLAKIEQIGARGNDAFVFASYFAGLTKQDSHFVSDRLDELVYTGRVTAEAIVNATGYLSGDFAGVKRVEKLLQEKRVDPVYVEKVLSGGGWINSLTSEEYLRLLRAIAGPGLEHSGAVIEFFGMWLHGQRPVEGDLAEFAWRCLEAPFGVTAEYAYDCDQLASKLAHSDIERGFELLEKLLTQACERKNWNPIDRYRVGEGEFWNVLHKADRRRALRMAFSVPLNDPRHRFLVTWDLEDVLAQENDADILIEFALESEDQAALVAESITSAKPGFWYIAFKIFQKYPSSSKIESALTHGIDQMKNVFSGPISNHLKSGRKEVEHRLKDPKTPPAARTWLREVLSRMEGQISQHIIWEYDESVNDLRRHIEDKNSPERIWAIGRVLKFADLKDIRRLLTVEDIAEGLPQVDLPEKKRRALERAIEVWQSGS